MLVVENAALYNVPHIEQSRLRATWLADLMTDRQQRGAAALLARPNRQGPGRPPAAEGGPHLLGVP